MYAHEKKIYFTILIAGLLLAVIIVFFVINILKYQKKRLISYEEKLIVEATMLENERRRIAFDLHDDLGAMLSAIKLHLQSIDFVEVQHQGTIDIIGKHIDDSIDKIRAIARDLMPIELEENSLHYAFVYLVERLNESKSINIKYNNLDEILLSKHQNIHMFRIVQEIVNNTLKHAHANTIELALSQKGNMLILNVSDDGIGFDIGKIQNQKKGLGLHNIISRVDLLKGDLFVETKEGKGTSYYIEIPIQS